mmetsp:Transcript_27305/g.31807  ORF Transcript_27305/g.31807 Transcript_27305/m.31807 type:complete len:561 (-) Transcript_27305:174-1856(-)
MRSIHFFLSVIFSFSKPASSSSSFAKNAAFITSQSSSSSATTTLHRKSPCQLFYTDDSNNNNKDNRSQVHSKNDTVRRASIKGISVSPGGFLMLLQTLGHRHSHPKNEEMESETVILPMRLTSGQKDAFAATTPESLTICQLLSDVDMAGAILPPDVLNSIVALYCSSLKEYEIEDDEEVDIVWQDELGTRKENKNENSISIEDELGLEQMYQYEEEYEDFMDSLSSASSSFSSSSSVKNFVHDFLLTSLGQDISCFEEATTYQRRQTIFPKITLDSITIDLPSFFYNEDEKRNGKEEEVLKWIEDAISQYVVKASTENAESIPTTTAGNEILVPLPFQFTLETRIDGDKTLEMPLYSENEMVHNVMYQKNKQVNNIDAVKSSSSSFIMEENQNILQQVLYSYDDQCSGAFLSMSLALRYKCPIVITSRALDVIESIQHRIKNEHDDKNVSICIVHQNQNENIPLNSASVSTKKSTSSSRSKNNGEEDPEMAIQRVLPQWRSIQKLHNQSQRVVKNVEQGFQLTKLQGALRIAMEKGDNMAAEKIRQAINNMLGDDGNIQ